MSNLSRFSHFTFEQLVDRIEALESENMRLRNAIGARNQLRIEDTELSSRTLRALSFAEIVFLTDLVHYSKQDLLKIRGIGTKAVFEVESILKAHGLKLSL